jgi:hypothetical protein
MEAQAAAAQAVAPPPLLPAGEAMAMLARRGFRPEVGRPDLPFARDLEGETAERLGELLGHYSFRLFLRGAIQRRGDFAPGEATRYLTAAQEKALADALVELGLLVRTRRDRYRFLRRATSFGPTLEWYVARELRRRLGCDVATGVKFRAPGLGGDLDVVAAMEGKLIYLELKSSPPKHLTQAHREGPMGTHAAPLCGQREVRPGGQRVPRRRGRAARARTAAAMIRINGAEAGSARSAAASRRSRSAEQSCRGIPLTEASSPRHAAPCVSPWRAPLRRREACARRN